MQKLVDIISLDVVYLVKFDIQKPPIYNFTFVTSSEKQSAFSVDDQFIHRFTNEGLYEVCQIMDYESTYSPVIYNLPVSDGETADQDEFPLLQLYVSGGSQSMQRYVDEWYFECTDSCKAHLVAKKTGKVLKRYEVTVDPNH